MKKIGFCGFWNNLDPENNYFTNLLRKYYTVEISDDPDYLFCSVFSNQYVYNEKAVRIFYTGECQTPDFNLVDYALGFDRIEFGDRYCRLPIYLLYGEDLLREAIERNGMRSNPQYRERFCSFIYSNPNADSVRTEFFNQMSSKIHIDSGGRYMNNIGKTVDDKVEFEKNYRFSVAFENYAYPGYMSEKILQAFAAGTVPIYWGDPGVDQVLNSRSFVNISRYSSIAEAVGAIVEINNDRDKYLSMVSEPICYDGNDESIKLQQNKAELFIKGIFDRPKDEVFRRNKGLRGKNYERFFRRYSKIDECLRSIRDMVRR